ncbi:hypothetical protein BJX76DRAFT_344747 [Aspergillus varians]
MNLHPRVRSITNYNVSTFRQHYVSEIAGSLGDLGTFLPIALALAANGTVSLASTLIFSGLFNILTGLFFGIPLPVQPMKAIAAVAIAQSFSPGSIAAAGLFVAAVLFVGSITGLLQWFTRVIPIPVVKGIQVGAGLSLVMAACTNLHNLGWIHPSWADNRLWAIGVFVALLLTNSTSRRLPYALIVFIIGIGLAIIHSALSSNLPSFSFWNPYTVVPVGHEWSKGAIDAGLGQLPLTTLNSVVAVVHLAADLLPSVPTPSVTAIGLSVSAMNLIGCWFGAMPVCHGSGGLAAQYRFGARSGASVIFLGLCKLILGLLFGESLVDLLHRFPKALLAVMVIAAGLELVRAGESLNTTGARDLGRHAEGAGDSSRFHLSEEERTRRWMVMMVTVGLLVGFKNDAVGTKPQPKMSGLTPSQLTSFRENGYLVLPNYLTPEETASLITETNTLLSTFDISTHPLTQFTTGDDAHDNKPHVGDSYFLTSGDKIRYFFEPDAIETDPLTGASKLSRSKETAVNKIGHALHSLSAPFKAVSISERNAAVARSLGFQDPRVLQSMVICKQPGIGGAVPPHKDSEFLYTSPPSAVGFWFALQDAGPGNATLGMYRGSHRTEEGAVTRRFVRRYNEGGEVCGTEFVKNEGEGFPRGLEVGGNKEDGGEVEVLDVKAGSLVLIHGNVLHKSEKNTGGKSRFAYTFHVIEGGEGWEYDDRNWLQPPEEGFSKLYQ